uniref:RNA-directed DNA polymerase n=1 Tax=Trichogramma kaykai TaxID=54128 RepID=A0ABD2X731_9HYME
MLKRLQQASLQLNYSKCVFGEEKVEFLGYLVSSAGYKLLANKVESTVEFPRSKTIEELRRFLGIINFYRNSIPHAAEMQAHLNKFLSDSRKNDKRPVDWDNSAIAAFEKCKQSLVDVTLLDFPRPDAPIRVITDASDTAMGGALEQRVEETWRPLAFFSGKFNPAQTRYSTFDSKLTAMTESVKYFDYYLEGRKFTLVTDHKPLIYSHNQSHDKAPPRRLRQLIYLAQFEVNYEYLPGKSNDVADALSRIESAPAEPIDEPASCDFPLSIGSITIPPRIDLPDIMSAQNEDSELSDILKDPNHKLKLKIIPLGSENLKIYCESGEGVNRPYLPASLRKESFSLYHGDAHPSTRAMKRRVKEHFVWPNMDKDIARVI